jgi:hypothetical protein
MRSPGHRRTPSRARWRAGQVDARPTAARPRTKKRRCTGGPCSAWERRSRRATDCLKWGRETSRLMRGRGLPANHRVETFARRVARVNRVWCFCLRSSRCRRSSKGCRPATVGLVWSLRGSVLSLSLRYRCLVCLNRGVGSRYSVDGRLHRPTGDGGCGLPATFTPMRRPCRFSPPGTGLRWSYRCRQTGAGCLASRGGASATWVPACSRPSDGQRPGSCSARAARLATTSLQACREWLLVSPGAGRSRPQWQPR